MSAAEDGFLPFFFTDATAALGERPILLHRLESTSNVLLTHLTSFSSRM